MYSTCNCTSLSDFVYIIQVVVARFSHIRESRIQSTQIEDGPPGEGEGGANDSGLEEGESGDGEGSGGEVDPAGVGPAAPVAVVPLAAVPLPKTKCPHIILDIGVIVISPKTLDGHCKNPAHNLDKANPCSKNRTRKPANEETTALGRPGAWLCAWMECAFDFPDQASHQKAGHHIPSQRSDKGKAALTEEIRKKWRTWLVDNGHKAILDAERLLRDGEPQEQPML